mmetsp:Transcript_74270/g.194793  ORF Transcript_74270/g.194793 Transcript_74270/m.194793 type:complete len:225 (+) Transcript_74270:59-733(+)
MGSTRPSSHSSMAAPPPLLRPFFFFGDAAAEAAGAGVASAATAAGGAEAAAAAAGGFFGIADCKAACTSSLVILLPALLVEALLGRALPSVLRFCFSWSLTTGRREWSAAPSGVGSGTGASSISMSPSAALAEEPCLLPSMKSALAAALAAASSASCWARADISGFWIDVAKSSASLRVTFLPVLACTAPPPAIVSISGWLFFARSSIIFCCSSSYFLRLPRNA